MGHPGPPLSPMIEPNGVWCADFKGQFKTRDGVYCYPLTVTDGYSRYLLCCQGLASTRTELAKPVFTRLLEEYGLPRVIRTDNGSPFASTALGRLSHLSVWWIRLGIQPERRGHRRGVCRRNRHASIASGPSSTRSVPTRRSTRRRQGLCTSVRRGSFLGNCRRSNTPNTSRLAT